MGDDRESEDESDSNEEEDSRGDEMLRAEEGSGLDCEEVEVETAGTSKQKGPRAKRSPVWQYCLRGRCKFCKKEYKKPKAGNIQSHLARMHKKRWEAEIREEVEGWHKLHAKKPETGATVLQQAKLDSGGKGALNAKKAEKYNPDGLKARQLNEAYARFAALPCVSLNSVRSEEFKKFIALLNEKFDCPASWTKQRKLIKIVFDKMITKLKELLSKGDAISMSTDIWSVKGMNASYLGVTAHFYSPDLKKIMNVLLGLRPVKGSHTAVKVKQVAAELCAEFDIAEDKIFRWVTDNGSNMVAAFRDDLIEVSYQQEAEEAGRADGNPVAAMSWMAALGLEDTDDEVDDIARDIAEFTLNDEDYSTEFKKRMSCACHDIELVLRSTVDKHLRISSAILLMLQTIRKVKKSVQATEYLLESKHNPRHLNLLLPARTRWGSVYTTICRYLEIKSAVQEVAGKREYHWDLLSYAEVEELEGLATLLKPFYTATNFLQAENVPTLPKTLPTLLNLKIGLEKAKNSSTIPLALHDLVEALAEELARRFQRVDDSGSAKFDCTYVIATLLNPNDAWLVSDQLKSAVRLPMLALLSEFVIDSAEPTADSAAVSDPTEDNSNSEFPELAASLANNRAVPVRHDSTSAGQGGLQLDKYMSTFGSRRPIWAVEDRTVATSNKVDPLDFWLKRQSEFGLLTKLAVRVLAVPTSSGPVERIFSEATEASHYKKGNTGPQLLEQKVMMKCNSKIIDMC